MALIISTINYLIPIKYAIAKINNDTVTHIYGNVQFPAQKRLQLVFSDTIFPNIKFSIHLNNLKRETLMNALTYKFFIKRVDINAEIPMGIARFCID